MSWCYSSYSCYSTKYPVDFQWYSGSTINWDSVTEGATHATPSNSLENSGKSQRPLGKSQ